MIEGIPDVITFLVCFLAFFFGVFVLGGSRG